MKSIISIVLVAACLVAFLPNTFGASIGGQSEVARIRRDVNAGDSLARLSLFCSLALLNTFNGPAECTGISDGGSGSTTGSGTGTTDLATFLALLQLLNSGGGGATVPYAPFAYPYPPVYGGPVYGGGYGGGLYPGSS